MPMYNRKNLWRKFQFLGILVLGLPLALHAQGLLKQGTWFSFAIPKSGFYRIDLAWLNKHQITGDPRKFGLYTSPAGMLSQDPAKAPAQSLLPVPIAIEGEANGQWDAADQLIFWGDSPHGLQFDAKSASWNQETHAYTDSSYYFLRIDDPSPARILTISPAKGNGSPLNFAQTLSRYDPEKYNLIQSGRTWLGDAFYGTGNLALQYDLKDVVLGQLAQFKAQLYSSGIAPGKFTLTIPGNAPVLIEIPAISGNRYDQKANASLVQRPILVSPTNNIWNWNIAYQSQSGSGYLDFIQVSYARKFNASTELPLYLFTHTRDTTVNLQIPNLGPVSLLWLKNGQKPWQKIQAPGNEMEIQLSPGSQIAMGNASSAAYPVGVTRMPNQAILDQNPQLKLLIITSAPLLAAAEKLAQYKTNTQKIRAQAVTTTQIYREFSGGKQDITAIRNYIKALASRTALQYVILLGDASVDYKDKSTVATSLEKSCYVPTYQSLESVQPLLSYSSDDYFGIIDSLAGDWEVTKPNMQVAIGRIPAKNPAEANMFVQKLIDYQNKQSIPIKQPYRFGWVADDGDFSIHMQDAEDFAGMLQAGNFAFDFQKTYVDQFPMESSNGQYTSVAAKKQVLDLFTRGADFIHFLGHGSESGWTDEKILTNNDLVGLKNSQHLPMLLTATCQFGRFDDPNQLSGGEIALLSPQGGAIALMSTTRPVFQSSNYAFGKAFYTYLTKHVTSPDYRLGDLFRDAKNASKTGFINRNLSLLGDPSMPLPWQSNRMKISPEGENWKATLDAPVDGTATAFYYAEGTSAKTLGTKGTPFAYPVPGKLIGKSAHTIKQGVAQLTAKSLPESGNPLVLKLIGQTNTGAISGGQIVQKKSATFIDNTPPNIQIRFPNEPEAGVFSADPLVEITISDDQGLRWQGPNDATALMTLNDTLQIPLLPFWEPMSNLPNQGKIQFPFSGLKKGSYMLRVNCWDRNNNASFQTLSFTVGENVETKKRWKLYPNPAQSRMTYQMKPSTLWSSDRYELKMYNISGAEIYRQAGDMNPLNNLEAGFEFPVDKLEAGTMGFIWINVLDNKGQIVETVKSKIMTLK